MKIMTIALMRLGTTKMMTRLNTTFLANVSLKSNVQDGV